MKGGAEGFTKVQIKCEDKKVKRAVAIAALYALGFIGTYKHIVPHVGTEQQNTRLRVFSVTPKTRQAYLDQGEGKVLVEEVLEELGHAHV